MVIAFLATGFCSPSSTFRSSELYGKKRCEVWPVVLRSNVHATVVRHAESSDIVVHALTIFRRDIGVLSGQIFHLFVGEVLFLSEGLV